MKKSLYCLLLLVFVLSSCSLVSDKNIEPLRVATEKEISTLNYQKTASTLDMEQISQFMEGLLQFDENSEVIPAGATDWSVSEDGLTYRFALRKDAKWSDGSLVVAADYYFAWKEIIVNKTSPFAYTLFPIKNAEKIYNGELSESDFGVSVIDDFTLEIHLEKPYLSFIYSLATATMYPIQQSFYETVGKDEFGTTKENMLTNGAYDIKEYDIASHLFLEKNETYWERKNVAIPQIEIYTVKEAATRKVLFDDGKLDIVKLATDYSESYRTGDLQVLDVPTSKITYLYLSGNTLQNNEVLANTNLRKAITYGIDKTVLTDHILKDGSQPLTRIVPCEYAYVANQDYCDLVTNNTPYTFNQEMAKEFFQKAQEELGKKELSFEMYYQETESNTKVLENIKFQLEELLQGLQIKLVAAPVNAYSQTLRKNGVASAVQTWSGSFPNPELYLQVLEKDSSFNFAKYDDEIFQQKYHEAMLQTNKQHQFEIYGEAENRAMLAYMFIPLYQNGTTYVLGSNIKNFNYKMTIPYVQYKRITFK